MRLSNWLLLFFLSLFLLGCQFSKKSDYQYPDGTRPQIALPSEIVNKKLSAREVSDRQKDLANYINYLHHYYIAVDLLYRKESNYDSGESDLPQFKYAQCKVVRDLFRQVELPPPPKRKEGMSHSDAIGVLFDHIEVLRREIRSNNQKMKELKKLYHHCLQ